MPRVDRVASYRGKRLLDLVLASVLFAPAAPVTLLCAILIKLDDGGPVLFRQERVGRDGKPFDVLKLRTMHHGESNPLFPSDDHITRVGRVLRRLSLDELPQLVNVLRGDMSIVGPRPTLPYQVARYTDEQRRRLSVRPGLTGLAQVRGRNTLTWAERIELDLEYLGRQSIWFDLKVLALSVPVVVGADVGGHSAEDPIARLDHSSDD
jgi:sugar transferase EpsL